MVCTLASGRISPNSHKSREVCHEPYHCTLDVCMMNKIHHYLFYVQARWLACILPLRHNNKYFVTYWNIVLEMEWTDLSMGDVSRRIFGDGCDSPNCMDMALTRPKTYRRMQSILILKYGLGKAKYFHLSEEYFRAKCITHWVTRIAE